MTTTWSSNVVPHTINRFILERLARSGYSPENIADLTKLEQNSSNASTPFVDFLLEKATELLSDQTFRDNMKVSFSKLEPNSKKSLEVNYRLVAKLCFGNVNWRWQMNENNSADRETSEDDDLGPQKMGIDPLPSIFDRPGILKDRIKTPGRRRINKFEAATEENLNSASIARKWKKPFKKIKTAAAGNLFDPDSDVILSEEWKPNQGDLVDSEEENIQPKKIVKTYKPMTAESSDPEDEPEEDTESAPANEDGSNSDMVNEKNETTPANEDGSNSDMVNGNNEAMAANEDVSNSDMVNETNETMQASVGSKTAEDYVEEIYFMMGILESNYEVLSLKYNLNITRKIMRKYKLSNDLNCSTKDIDQAFEKFKSTQAIQSMAKYPFAQGAKVYLEWKWARMISFLIYTGEIAVGLVELGKTRLIDVLVEACRDFMTRPTIYNFIASVGWRNIPPTTSIKFKLPTLP